MRRVFFQIVIFFVSTGASLLALDVRLLSWSGELNDLEYRVAGKAVGISANDGALSPSYAIGRSSALKIYRTGDEAQDDEPVLVMPLPEPTVTRAILILADTPKDGLRGLWLDDSPDVSSRNTIRVHNLSRRLLAFQAGGDDWKLDAGDSRTISFDAAARQVGFRIAAESPEGWKILWGSQLPVRNNYRVRIIVRDSPRPGEARGAEVYQVNLYDYAPPEPSAADSR